MKRREVRQRVNPTYQQTFYFFEKSIPQAIPSSNNKCNFIDHPITFQQTEEQIRHKKSLNQTTDDSKSNEQTAKFMSSEFSKTMKENDLKGQLQQCGIQFWLREPQKKQMSNSKLQATSHNFQCECFGTVGRANEKCPKLSRDHDREMRLRYDLGHQNSGKSIKLFSFGPK